MDTVKNLAEGDSIMREGHDLGDSAPNPYTNRVRPREEADRFEEEPEPLTKVTDPEYPDRAVYAFGTFWESE